MTARVRGPGGTSSVLAFLKTCAQPFCRMLCRHVVTAVPRDVRYLRLVTWLLIFPSNSLLMSVLLHGCLWKGLTKSSVLYRRAWTPGAEGSVTQWLCQERQALFFHLSAPSCSFSLALFLSQRSCIYGLFMKREKEKTMSLDSVVLLFPCGHMGSMMPSSGTE